MRRSVLFAFCFRIAIVVGGLILAVPLHAQQINGIWSDNGCQFGSRTKIISGAGMIDIFPAGDTMVLQVVLTSESQFVNGTYTAVGSHPLFDQSLNVSLSMSSGRLLGQFERCEGLPVELSWMIGEPIGLFLSFDDALAACVSGDDDQCFQQAFEAIDVFDDDKLSVAEISRFFRAMAFYAGYYSSENMQVSLETTMGAMAVSSLVSPVLAKNIVSGSDYNADGLLGVDELLIDRDTSGISTSVAALRVGAVDTVSALLRSMISQVSSSALTGAIFR